MQYDYDRIVIGYHGCDAEVARDLLDGVAFKPSKNDFDWLGWGAYFWESGPDRAFRFAEEQERRGKIQTPAVVGALIQLGNCFDLLDTRFTKDLADAYVPWIAQMQKAGAALPVNGGGPPDFKLRRLDCAVLNFFLDAARLRGVGYDTVRGAFQEGDPIYPGSGIYRATHIQIAVRTPGCIRGVFRPSSSRGWR